MATPLTVLAGTPIPDSTPVSSSAPLTVSAGTHLADPTPAPAPAPLTVQASSVSAQSAQSAQPDAVVHSAAADPVLPTPDVAMQQPAVIAPQLLAPSASQTDISSPADLHVQAAPLEALTSANSMPVDLGADPAQPMTAQEVLQAWALVTAPISSDSSPEATSDSVVLADDAYGSVHMDVATFSGDTAVADANGFAAGHSDFFLT